jgi:hypothetical protein
MLRRKPPWLQALFPWELQALRVTGRTMAYLDEGPRGSGRGGAQGVGAAPQRVE